MGTQNITLSLSRELLRKVKLLATQRQTSVSGLLTQQLEDLVERESGYSMARAKGLALLDHGYDLGTEGDTHWQRDDLHER